MPANAAKLDWLKTPRVTHRTPSGRRCRIWRTRCERYRIKQFPDAGKVFYPTVRVEDAGGARWDVAGDQLKRYSLNAAQAACEAHANERSH